MTVDHRTRRHSEIRELGAPEVLDTVVPAAIAVHGPLAGRGVDHRGLPPLGFEVTANLEGDADRAGHDTAFTLGADGGTIAISPGTDRAGIIARLAPDALSDLVQDVQSTMGLAMTARVQLTRGDLNDWIGWEPVLRALFDGRKVHEPGDVTFADVDGGPLDLDRTFDVDDDRDEMAHFLTEAGFLHLREVFEPDEMAAVAADIDTWLARATPDDGASWWATDADDQDLPVRILQFLDKSPALQSLVADERFTWLAALTGDGHRHSGGAEGLIKPLGIVRGLSDLPWHKDCGQGKHAYMCNSLTCGISVTGADRVSGALGVIGGSHRANTMATGRDRGLDLPARLLETHTGDVTVHCSDTLHRAHPPTERPRKVVYTDFRLAPLPGDEPRTDPRYGRAARAQLSNVQDRIDASVAG